MESDKELREHFAATDGGRELGMYQASTRTSAGELAAGVVHDLNNPLQVMMLHLELLQSGRPMPNWIEMFGQQVQRISGLAARLRDFAHAGGPGPSAERVDVNRCIEEVLGVMEEELRRGGIAIERSFCSGRVEVAGSVFALKQVLLELFLNAREAMDGGGVVRVETVREDGRVVLRIADSGPGVAPEVQDEVFKPFITTRGSGRVGIGLAICARAVARLGGEIRLEERGGGGAGFRIVLPALPE